MSLLGLAAALVVVLSLLAAAGLAALAVRQRARLAALAARARAARERFEMVALSGNSWLWETDTEQRLTYLSRLPRGADPGEVMGKRRDEFEGHADDLAL